MPKKKDAVTDEEILLDAMGLPLHKKHKKHKHKKHKRKKGQDGEFDEGSGGGSPPTPGDSYKPGFKLKIKIGGQSFGEARVAKAEVNETVDEEGQNIDVVDGDPSDISVPVSSANGNQPVKSAKKVDEEEAWLAALEAGRLEEVDDELRRMKDPNLMTARQRALLESKAQKEKDDVVPVVQEEKELTEEMIQRRIIRAKKRKQQAEEKREKDKKQTIERLLKKTDAKIKGSKKLMKRTDVPKVTYIYSQVNGPSLSLPPGINFLLQAQVAKAPAAAIQCGVEGCSNTKKYSCSKTGVPLCSLECYKKNLSSRSLLPSINVA